MHKCAPGYSQYAGVYAKALVLGEYNSGWYDLGKESSDVDYGYSNAGCSVGARIPGFFPLSITASLFPSSAYFASASASAVLFSYEIQKGIPAVSLYADRFVLSASYTSYKSYGTADSWDISRTVSLCKDFNSMHYYDLASLSADVILSLNTSALASSSYRVEAGGKLLFRPNCEPGKSKLSGVLSCILVY